MYADNTSAVTTYFDEDMNETCSRPLKKRKWATLPKDEPPSTDSDSSDDSSAFLTDEDDISHHSDFTDLTNNSVFVFYFAFQNPKNVSVRGCDNDVTGLFLRNRVGNNHVETYYDRGFEENYVYITSAKRPFQIRNLKKISFGNKREFHGNSSTKNFQDSKYLDDNNNMDCIGALRLNSTQTFQKGKLYDYEYLNMHKIKKKQRNSKKMNIKI